MLGLGLGVDRGGFVPSFSPSDLANLEAWYKADAGITTVSSAVSVWADQSGNGRDVTQGTAANRPAYGSETLNGIDVLTFDGSDWLTNTTLADWKFLVDGGEYSLFCVAKAGNSANPNAAYAYFGTQVIAPFIYNILLYDDRSSVSRNNQISHEHTASTGVIVIQNRLNDTILPNQFNVISVLADPDNATAADRSIIRVNDDADLANNASTTAPTNANPSGAFEIGRASVLPLVGAIAEIIMYNRKLSATEAGQVRDYLQAKYAL